MKTGISPLMLLSMIVLFSFSGTDIRAVKKNFRAEGPSGNVYIIVDKSDYELRVYDDLGWYATYPVVFGSKNLEDKYMEGDKRTPEGNFKIISKRSNHKWNKMLLIDYPNQQSWEKFNNRKARGLIAKNARIGGGIGIHGTWPNDNIVVDDYTNWTNGCISMKNTDLDAIEPYLNVGTPVTIKR